MYASDNAGNFPTGGNAGTIKADSDDGDKERESLGKLFNQYVTDRKIFKCPSDSGVSDVIGGGVMLLTTTPNTFTQHTCSYGYDDNHTSADDTGVAIASDRLGTDTASTQLSNNHNHKGQNVVYIDGHVEWKGTHLVGYFNGTAFDDIWVSTSGTTTAGVRTATGTATVNSTATTDTAILQ